MLKKLTLVAKLSEYFEKLVIPLRLMSNFLSKCRVHSGRKLTKEVPSSEDYF